MGPAAADRGRDDLIAIFRAGVAAVDPERLVFECFQSAPDPLGELPPVSAVKDLLVVGAGKAAAAMAAGCERAVGSDRVHGLVVVPDGCDRELASIEVCKASHPIPDRRSLEATERICRRLEETAHGPILCLLSGGASSLLVRPIQPVTLEDKGCVTQLLLTAGVEIGGLNTLRKHLSHVKGGGLLRLASQRPLLSLLVSDVVGDDPGTIGSGPTVPDPTTFADAEAVLERAGIRDATPDSVLEVLRKGRLGEIPETVKPGDPAVRRSYYRVIGSNRTALHAAATEATRFGYHAIVREAALAGETNDAARCWYEEIQHQLESRPRGRYCFLAGGETVVEVRGSGKGGRNQEFALALVPRLEGSDMAVLSAGTDGVDGPTDAAGAFVDGTSGKRARGRALDVHASLQANDSYTFFRRLDDLFRCGPTGTNVMDVKIAVVSTISGSDTGLKR